ncbi:MAG TPA: peptide chain release factor N(5)-glutamine methyltransferase [Silvibacterium sp.]|nr:peptide chain release factor N(5)-glutamine methyltransferase [Silvibacterium sp.]
MAEQDAIAERESITDALARGSVRLGGLDTARRDAELLLMHAIGCDRAYLLAHSETALTQEEAAAYEEWLARRARNEPIQYIVGEQEFFGLKFRVTPDVLIPRPETEYLVEAALARADRDAHLRIADIGTGSGSIAIALAHALPNAEVDALDISPAALNVARENAETYGVASRIHFVESDLLAKVGGKCFDLIVSNPPYVAEGESLEPQVRDFEPASALFAGADGLDAYRRLIPQAGVALKVGGWLLMEIGHGQRPAVIPMLTGFKNVTFVDDLQGIPRIACAQKGNDPKV